MVSLALALIQQIAERSNHREPSAMTKVSPVIHDDSAEARPMPLDAPLTTATLPASLFEVFVFISVLALFGCSFVGLPTVVLLVLESAQYHIDRVTILFGHGGVDDLASV